MGHAKAYRPGMQAIWKQIACHIGHANMQAKHTCHMGPGSLVYYGCMTILTHVSTRYPW